MTKVYLIRHAEAEGNYYRRIQGQWDGGITARGQKQIAALARRMKDIPIDALYSSDLTRTMLTAGAIQAYHDLPLVTDRRLREIRVGQWEGQSWGNFMYDAPEAYNAFTFHPDLFSTPGAESWTQLQDRMVEVLTELAAKHDGQTIAVVSHGTAIRSMMCRVLGVAGQDIHTVPHGDNTCVSELEISGSHITLKHICDSSHISEADGTLLKQTWMKKDAPNLNLRFRPLDLNTEGQFYLDCYADAWRTAHGDTEGFLPALYLISAKRWQSEHPQALMMALNEDTPVGVVALDTQRGAQEGIGWVAFWYLLPEFRRQRYFPQLLGYADYLYTQLGRSQLCLSVSEDNPHAQAVYEHCGFVPYDCATGVGAPLLLMKKPLGKGLLPI